MLERHGVRNPKDDITATPGMFCEAMVTMNSGRLMLATACQENSGATNSSVGSTSICAQEWEAPIENSPHPTAPSMLRATA